MGVTEDIVRFVDESRFDALPDEVVFRTKTLIADAIGTILAGSCEDGSRILQKYLKQSGGREEATVIAAGFKGCASAAALANAAAGHALDFDSIQLSSFRSWHPHPSDRSGTRGGDGSRRAARYQR